MNLLGDFAGGMLVGLAAVVGVAMPLCATHLMLAWIRRRAQRGEL